MPAHGWLFPGVSADADDLADWVELRVLAGRDPVVSTNDLVGHLRTSGTIDAEPDVDRDAEEDERYESVSDEVFAELQRRADAAGSHYPFEVGRALSLREDRAASPYAFLTALWRFGPKFIPEKYPERTFERMATEAARAYLGHSAEAVRFGAPRDEDLPGGFSEALVEILRRMGERAALHPSAQRSGYQTGGDGKLDVIAWVPFPDGKRGKTVAFGQCAVGRDWASKKAEFQFEAFRNKYIATPLAIQPVRLFFVPWTRRDDDVWGDACFDGGVVFDRCRMTYLLGTVEHPSLLTEITEWTCAVLHTSEE